MAEEVRRVLVQAKLPEDLVKEVDHLSVDWGVYRAEAIQRLLRWALDSQKTQGSLSLGKA